MSTGSVILQFLLLLSGATAMLENVQNSSRLDKKIFLNSSMPDYLTTAIPHTTNNRTTLKLLASVSYDTYFFAYGPVCTVAMELALQRLRSLPNWLPNYDLEIQLINDKCIDDVLIGQLMKYLNSPDDTLRLPIYLTDNCMATSQAITSSIVHQYNYLSFTMVQETPELHYNRERFTSEFGLGESSDATFLALCEFILQMGWNKVAILSEIFEYFNAVDGELIPMMERLNITILWMGKITYASRDDEEMMTAFTQMAAHDPRIILANLDSAIAFSCWCYRFGLYGPKYVHFIQYWSYFNAEMAEIPAFLPWCKRYMIREIVKSVFFFGDSIVPAVFGMATKDSTGWTYPEFQAELSNRIVNARSSPAWNYWPPICYDVALFAGAFVNATETRLNSQNSTLSQWIAENKGSDVFMETLFNSSKVNGFKGEYQFEAETTRNTQGYTPLTISQVQNGFLTLVAYRKSNEIPPFVPLSDKLVWQTKDGQPPEDSMKVIYRQMPLATNAEAIVFVVIGSLGIAINALFMILSIRCNTLTDMKVHDYITFSGNVLMCVHLCLYLSVSTYDSASNDASDVFCYSYTALLVIGYCISTAGSFVHLEQGLWMATEAYRATQAYARRMQPTPNNVATTNGANVTRNNRRVSTVSIPGSVLQPAIYYPSNNFINKKQMFLYSGLNAVVFIPLITIWLAGSSEPILKVSVRQKIEQIDSSTACQPFIYECRLNDDDLTSTGLLIAIVALQICLLLRMSFTAYTLRSKFGQYLAAEHRNATICFYCKVLVLVAGALIAVTNLQNGRFLQMTASSVSICFCLLTIGFKVATRVATPEVNASQLDYYFPTQTQTTTAMPLVLVRRSSLAPPAPQPARPGRLSVM